MKRYLGLWKHPPPKWPIVSSGALNSTHSPVCESKSLGGRRWPWLPGLGTDSFGHGYGICGLTASALWRIPLGAMTSVTLQPCGQIDAYWPGAWERFFLLLGQAAPLPFFALSSLPLPSRYPLLPIQSFTSRPLLLPFSTFDSLPFTCKLPTSKTITTTTLH